MIRNLLVLPTGEELFSGVVGENAISGVKLTQCVNSEEELTPGAVCANMLEASVIVQKPLSLTAGEEVVLYTVSDNGQRERQGVYIAEKPVWESTNRYTLTAYDRVSKLDKDLSSWLENLSGWPYSLLDFASMVCSECGLELITQEIPNGDYSVQAFSGEGITGRQLIQWVGQAAGRFCRATKDGQIEFAWYKETDKIIGSGEKIIQTGPESVAILEEMRAGAPLQVVTEIKPSLAAKRSAKLYRRGRNVLDLQTVGIYHSNKYGNIRHSMEITDTGIRLDVVSATPAVDRTFWGFCLGTAEELAGKTITVSADFSTSRTDKNAIPYMSFFGIDAEPVFDPRKNFTSLYGGLIPTAAIQQLAYSSGEGVRAVTYTATGKETKKYIAIFFAFCKPGSATSYKGEWTQWDNIQVEYADAPSPYQPYIYEEFSRSFSAIYGGSLNWNTGVLTVTHERIASYAGQTVPEGWISSTGKLSSGAQVVYPLETPYTIALKPQQIAALDGYNRLWSSTGNTTAGFHQDYYFLDSFSYKDYQIAPVEKVQIRQTDEDVGAIYPDTGENCNTYILSGNYLLTNASANALEAVAQVLYEQLKDITYTPCTLEVPEITGVNAGDVVTVMDKNGKELTVYVMNRTVSGQRSTLECTGSPRRDSSTAVNTQTYKALSGKVMELRTDIEGLRAEHRNAQGDFSRLGVTVEGIAAEVSRQMTSQENILAQMSSFAQTAADISLTVQSIQSNGVDKVKTEMGYTFDDKGLQISQEGAQMRNLLDNTGMYVKRDRDIVLQANNDGVQAINISVENYLTVGKHARFETYNNGVDIARTACFWIGG